MATFNPTVTSSTVQLSFLATATIPSALASEDLIEPLEVLEAIEDKLDRVNLQTERVGSATERIAFPNTRFSVKEIMDFASHATLEVMTHVRAEYLKPFRTTRNPSSGEWDLDSSLRILGSTARMLDSQAVSNVAKRVGTYVYRDLSARGIAFTDVTPVYISPSGDFEFHAATENPDDASVETIDAPSLSTPTDATGTATWTPATGVLTTASSFFQATWVGLPILLIDGDQGYGWIETFTSDTEVVVNHFGNLSSVGGNPDVSLSLPYFMSLPKQLLPLVVELAASDLFAAADETDLSASCLADYERLLMNYALRYFRLNPIERN